MGGKPLAILSGFEITCFGEADSAGSIGLEEDLDYERQTGRRFEVSCGLGFPCRSVLGLSLEWTCHLGRRRPLQRGLLMCHLPRTHQLLGC